MKRRRGEERVGECRGVEWGGLEKRIVVCVAFSSHITHSPSLPLALQFYPPSFLTMM
jgi:hypothetical protein